MSYEDTLRYFDKAANIMGVGARIEKMLITPVRQIKVPVTLEINGTSGAFSSMPPTNAAKGSSTGSIMAEWNAWEVCNR